MTHIKIKIFFKFLIENFIIFKWRNYWIWIKFRPEKFLSLSRKSLQRAEQRLNEIWTDQAKDWVSINQRSWEFESFQSKVSLFHFNVVFEKLFLNIHSVKITLKSTTHIIAPPSGKKYIEYILYSLNVISRLLLWDWIFCFSVLNLILHSLFTISNCLGSCWWLGNASRWACRSRWSWRHCTCCCWAPPR